MLKSGFCTFAQHQSEEFTHWRELLKRAPGRPHRKDWELAFIAQALRERGMLREGRLGLGFGCGTEPLPRLFASLGAKVVATDKDRDLNASSLEGRELLSDPDLVSYGTMDMNDVAKCFHGTQDFVWSTSSLEHLGSIILSNQFIEESLRCLKPGGVAVHVTEYAIYPQDAAAVGGTIFYTRDRLTDLLSEHGLEMDWNLGRDAADYFVDIAPYQGAGHLKLLVDGFVTTSLGLILEK